LKKNSVAKGLRVSENSMMRKMFEHERKGVTRDGEILE
jgi:hypothetical protein